MVIACIGVVVGDLINILFDMQKNQCMLKYNNLQHYRKM